MKPCFARVAGAIGLVALVPLAGCETAVMRPLEVVCDFTPYLTAQNAGPALAGPLANTLSPVPINSARVTDQRIANKVLVQSVAARRTETGTVEVQARLVNCTDFPLQIQGRTMFLDANFMDTEPPSAWRRVFLSPRSLGQYSELSTGFRNISNFTIEIREGD